LKLAFGKIFCELYFDCQHYLSKKIVEYSMFCTAARQQTNGLVAKIGSVPKGA
jgi:hypothetical protein